MKTQKVKSKIFKPLVVVLMVTGFVANAGAKTISKITLPDDTSKINKMNMSQKPINAFSTWRVKEGQLSKVLKLLNELARKTRAEEGNIFYKVHQSNSDANTILFYEAYKDKAAVAAHQNSEQYKTLVLKTILPLLEDRHFLFATELDLD